MTRDEKIRRAKDLAAQGRGPSAIARELDVTPGCVSKWLDPERAREYQRRDRARPGRNEQVLAHARERVEPCPDCGGLRPRRARYTDSKRCRDCEAKARREAHRERDEQIVRWWNEEGLPMKEIAARLGWTRNRLCGELYVRLPQRGYEIKRRNRRRSSEGATAAAGGT